MGLALPRVGTPLQQVLHLLSDVLGRVYEESRVPLVTLPEDTPANHLSVQRKDKQY